MTMREAQDKDRDTGGRITPAMLVYMAILLVTPLALVARFASAEGPQWWSARQVLDAVHMPNDYAPVNMGQLKWVATNAMAEMDEHLSGGAGWAISNIVSSYWLDDNVNYAVVNIGQVRNLAAVFYDRLIEVGYANAYPWPTNQPCNDFAVANMGQVKALFDFDFEGKFAIYSGTFSYSGVQTGGTFHIFATTNSADWFDSQSNFNYDCLNPLDAMANLTESGEFAVTSALYAVNWFCAWLDADDDLAFDTGEPFLVANPGGTWVTGNTTGQVVMLQDPITVTFDPSEIAILANNAYTNEFHADIQVFAGDTNSVYTNTLGQLVIESQDDGTVQVTGISTTETAVWYSLLGGQPGSTYVQARLGNAILASQAVCCVSVSWNESTLKMVALPAQEWVGSPPVQRYGPNWTNAVPPYWESGMPKSSYVQLTVNPEAARSYFNMEPSNSNASACWVVGGNSTGIWIQADGPGQSVITTYLGARPAASFTADVVQAYFVDIQVDVLTNDTRQNVFISVLPQETACDVTFVTNSAGIADLIQSTNASMVFSVRGLTNGTCYFDMKYGTNTADRLKVNVMDMEPETTNLVMALDPVNFVTNHDWCKVQIGESDTVYDWSWANSLSGVTASGYGFFLPTEPAGVVVAELVTNAAISGISPPNFQLVVKPYGDAGGTAKVIARLNPTAANGWASNIYAEVWAHVVKARPFTNTYYVASNRLAEVYLDEANAPRGGWAASSYEYPGPTVHMIAQWPGVVGAEYRWVIEKQWCFQEGYEAVDQNAQYNPTAMVYFCDFWFTNSPYIGVSTSSWFAFTPIAHLPTNAPAVIADCTTITLRQTGGVGRLDLKVPSGTYSFTGSNTVTLQATDLTAGTSTNHASGPTKTWTLDGEVQGTNAGVVNLEYLIQHPKGVVVSNGIGLTVFVPISLAVDTDRNGMIDNADESGKDTWTLTRGAFFAPSFLYDSPSPYRPEGLPRLIVRAVSNAPGSSTLRLRRSSDAGGLRVVDCSSNTVLGANEVYTFTNSLWQTSDITFFLASCDFRDNPTLTNALEYRVHLELVDSTEAVISSNTVCGKVAPLILPAEVDPVAVVYATEHFSTNITCIANLVRFDSNEGGRWVQDAAKMTVTQFETGTVVDVACDLHRDNMSYFIGELAPRTGIVRRANFDSLWAPDGTRDDGNGGNMMATPPLPGKPYGIVLVGDAHLACTNYFMAQKVQTDICTNIPTKWLLVGHIDEVLMFVDSSTVLVPDPWTAVDIMHNAIVSGAGTNTVCYGTNATFTWSNPATHQSFFDLSVAIDDFYMPKTNSVPVPGMSAGTTNVMLTFTAHNFAVGDFLRIDNEIVEVVGASTNSITVARQKAGTAPSAHSTNTFVYALTEIIRWNLDIDDPCVITNIANVTNALATALESYAVTYKKLPVLFERSVDSDGVLRFVAGSANVVNCLVCPGSGVFMQDTGSCEFNASVSSNVPGATFIAETWDVYHLYNGEIHCGTAAQRTMNAATSWWDRVSSWQ